MDNIQKAGLAVIPAIGVIVTVIIVGSFWSTTAESDRCDEWNNEIEDMRAELYGRQNSLGGAFDHLT